MAISARMVQVVCMCRAPIPGHRTETGGETPAMDDLDIIADALRFLASKAGGIDQLPFDPFAAIERLRGRVLPELPEGWQIQAMDERHLAVAGEKKSAAMLGSVRHGRDVCRSGQ